MTSEGLVFDTRISPGARGDSRGLFWSPIERPAWRIILGCRCYIYHPQAYTRINFEYCLINAKM
jgi:hypothetical protein